MPIRWAWDQGRSEYFRFEKIQAMARALVSLNGSQATSLPDTLRSSLQAETGLPFAPGDYTVWRNYSRVFKTLLLATDRDGVLQVTDLAHHVDNSNTASWSLDDYLEFIIPRFYMTSPAREGYNSSSPVVFPGCALLRYLIANGSADLETAIFGHIIGNACEGNESIEFYRALNDSGYRPVADERRQVREMLTFLSQSSYFEFTDNVASLVLGPEPGSVVGYLWHAAQPIVGARMPSASDEVLRLGSISNVNACTIEPIGLPSIIVAAGSAPPPTPNSGYESFEDLQFTEGKQRRVQHLKTERSAKLKAAWVNRFGSPMSCDICGVAPMRHFPWLNSAGLHLHHVLPLSSSVHTALTALSDVKPICGICHLAVHAYYRDWLAHRGQDDFTNNAEAHRVYEAAKNAYLP
jgi:hypothetical protein